MLEVKNLHATIAGKEILKGINLTINDGEIHAIMGPNGSGKSTLSAVLTGNPLYTVTEGEAIFNGKNLLDMKPEDRAREGVVSPAAAAAPEPLQPALLVPVPPRPLRPAGRAGRLRTVEAGGIGEGPESDGFPAFPLVHGRRQQCEVAGIQAGDHLCEGIPLRHGGIPSAAWSLPGGIVAKQRARQAPGRILCLAAPSYHACWAQAHMFVTRVLDC